MSSKPSSVALKSSCDKLRSNLPPPSDKKGKIKLPKKVLISKKWHQNCCHEVKSHSVGIINSKHGAKPKKTTKSESTVSGKSKNLDICKKCGDTDDDIATAVSEYAETMTSKSNKTDFKSDEERPRTGYEVIEKQNMTEYYKNEKYDDFVKITKLTSKTRANIKKDDTKSENGLKIVEKEKQIIQEYYKNEKFQDLYDSMHDIDNGLRNINTLDTITEVNEKQTHSQLSSHSEKVSAESKVYFVESSDEETNVKQLKEFRDKNYFECHSARSRIKTKGSVTSLKELKKHKCNYRFYLNDRLFPVAVNNDYNDNIRCVDCHLPLELSEKEVEANGTIQAKVKLGSDTKDTMLILPVKEPLIIQQRRKEKKDSDVIYFGVIKLDRNGNSMFNRSLPSDSLALKYQKGYREFSNVQNYRYDKVDEGDVIVI